MGGGKNQGDNPGVKYLLDRFSPLGSLTDGSPPEKTALPCKTLAAANRDDDVERAIEYDNSNYIAGAGVRLTATLYTNAGKYHIGGVGLSGKAKES